MKRTRKGKAEAHGLRGLILLLASAVLLGVILLLPSLGGYPVAQMLGFFRTPLIALLNVLPCLFFLCLFYALFARVGAAFLTGGILLFLLTAADNYLLLFRDDPLMAQDLRDISTGLGFAGKYDLLPGTKLAVALVCFLLLTVGVCLLGRGVRAGKRLRLTLAVLLLLSAFPLTLLYASDTVYEEKACRLDGFNEWSDTQRYISHGFLYPFLHSVKGLFPQRPEGYDEAEAEALFASYTDEKMGEGHTPDIIAVQLEAYADLTRLGIEGVDLSFFDAYHRLEEQGIAGDLVTNIFAGGTVDTERCFLTGLNTQENYRRETNSYAWYLQTQGYTVEGSHPGYDWFYNRRNVNRDLGFPVYRYYEDHYMELTNGGAGTDEVLADEIVRMYRAHCDASDAPYFAFHVSYQNHGPYDATASEENFVTGEMTEESRHILNNYLAGVRQTTDALVRLTEALEACDRPVLLLLYGDHKPWLGYGNSVYTELNADFDRESRTGLLNYYGTRYLLWGNTAAKAYLQNPLTGEGETVSSNFLMNLVFSVCGAKGSGFMQMTEETRQVLPVLPSTGFYLKGDTVRKDLSDAEAEALRRYDFVSCYYREHFCYGS